MPEQKFTAEEVATVLDVVAVALEQGYAAIAAMFIAVPGLAETKSPQEWLNLYVNQNVKHVRETAEIVRKG